MSNFESESVVPTSADSSPPGPEREIVFDELGSSKRS